MPRLSLLSRIWLSTSVVLTCLFALTTVLLQWHTLQSTNESLREEVKASFNAYNSLWKSRSDSLASIAGIVSITPNVRMAFQTRHRPTIRDAAGEMWVRVSEHTREAAFFVVTDPKGNMITSLDTVAPVNFPRVWPLVEPLRKQFPKQGAGFAVIENQLFQLVVTPVYVDSTVGPSLISVLVTGYVVDHLVAQKLKSDTGGSEFLFVSQDRVFASTLNSRATEVLHGVTKNMQDGAVVSDGVHEYIPLSSNLVDVEGRTIGSLSVFRSFDAARHRTASLRRDLFWMWLAAIAAGLGVSYVLAKRIIHPVEMLDRAAVEITKQNYDYRVPVEGTDEIGRLGATFNSMCQSIQSARQELIRQERISTIGRMASSIVHDLRNPLAAIYGGAETMVDTNLSPPQMKRLAENIYRSSRRIQEMLQDLLQVTRGKDGQKEVCALAEVVQSAVDTLQALSKAQNVEVLQRVDPSIEVSLERSRVERVFQNLIGNAVEAMPGGGHVMITAERKNGSVEVSVSDDGPGIDAGLRPQLFQPFATHGKKNGLGLGLALARQTVMDHGGDLWAQESDGKGATFRLRFPLRG